MTPEPSAGTGFDTLATDAPLGCLLRPGSATFRLFAPRATAVTLELFRRFDDTAGERLEMRRKGDGTWERIVRRDLAGSWYGYRIDGPRGQGEMFDPAVLVADPYSRAVTTVNHWRLHAKTLIVGEEYDWGNDRGPALRDQSALVIYECHVRDMTAHPSAGASRPGTYTGFSEEKIPGGLGHVLSLGVNAVELLPVMKFGTREIPYRDPSARTDSGRVNDWNPYERNHWGYMTSFFFAPETYYATEGSAEPGAVNGRDGRAGLELKDLVKSLHRRGIAVILDAVYNHTSHYDENPFKYADKRYYYRLDGGGAFLESSGCGNDFFTERPMARRVIVDSVKHWLSEYHVDGIRFDLAAMLDEETCRRITEEARAVRPGVVLIAEPWGGGRHHPAWFRELGWWSWNDRFRDGVKGRDPHHDRGLLFGSARAAGDPGEVLSGRLPVESPPQGRRESGPAGPGPDGPLAAPPAWSVNYVESHDGYTLGDFIRLATGWDAPAGGPPRGPAGGISDRPAAASRLTPGQLALNRFAAFVLLTSPGPVMLHEGQEFARSKAIRGLGPGDPEAGHPDHNSYNKDDATNHLDFGVREVNRDLFDYYRGLIGLRMRHPALRAPRDPSSAEIRGEDGRLVVTILGASGPSNRYIIVLNASPDRAEKVSLPQGRWFVLADDRAAYAEGNGPEASETLSVPPSSGMLLGDRPVPHTR